MEKADRFDMPENYDPMKAKFLRGTLQEEGEFIVDFQDEIIDRYLEEHSSVLRSRRGFSVDPSGEGYRLNIHFVKYLRFLDIKGKQGVAQNQLMLYNRVVFGRLNSIAGKLQYGYTEDIKQLLQKYYDNLQIPS